jgi:hypothetical protein
MMYSICKLIVADQQLPEKLAECAAMEPAFNRKIGVLDRALWQCAQQPHLIWSRTRWTTEKAHNEAAARIMKTRVDDRVASAYFRPGLYYEIFAREVASMENGPDTGRFLVVAHGLVADKRMSAWTATLPERMERLRGLPGLLSARTFSNYYCDREFVGFFEWRDEDAYAAGRLLGDLTVEETAYVGPVAVHSDLASYIQYECRPLILEEVAA